MSTQTNPVDSQDPYGRTSAASYPSAVNLTRAYNERMTFFADSFIRKLKEGNRKALGELLKYPVQPNHMDLRRELAACTKEGLPFDYVFSLADGRVCQFVNLSSLINEWAVIAEKALIESDPALADKLMSREQWNAKAAFEVAYLTAVNELEELKKTKTSTVNVAHYKKWTIDPLKRAMDSVKALNTPGNAPIGYVIKTPLTKALMNAETVMNEFGKLMR